MHLIGSPALSAKGSSASAEDYFTEIEMLGGNHHGSSQS